MSARLVVDREIDISGEICPMTFVRTQLALDALASGQVLGVMLRGEEPALGVPANARLQGHAVLAEETLADGRVWVVIRRR